MNPCYKECTCIEIEVLLGGRRIQCHSRNYPYLRNDRMSMNLRIIFLQLYGKFK